jgi:hypothetical protein
MKKIFLVSLFYFLIVNVVYGDVYVEYTRAMAEVLKDAKARGFASQVIGEQTAVLYAGTSSKDATVVKTPVETKGAEALFECFKEDRLNDECSANNDMERLPVPPVKSGFHILKELGSSLSDTSILFTSYADGRMKELTSILSQQSNPFYLLYYSVSKNHKLFYLSFSDLQHVQFLAGIQPFSRDDYMPSCITKCTVGRQVDFFNKCLQKRLPGFVKSVGYQFPDKPVLPTYIDCPQDTFPPVPLISPDLKTFQMPYTSEIFYHQLTSCQNKKSKKTAAPYTIKPNTDIKLRMKLEVLRTNPDVFNALPTEVSNMLTTLAGEPKKEYIKSTDKWMVLTISNCQ